MSEEKNQNEIEEVTNEDEHKDVEHYCYLCRRPESVAGKMLELPNNIFICTDCMQRTLNSMGNGQFGFIDARNMDLDSMDITKMMNDMQSMQPKAEVKKKKKDKKEIRVAIYTHKGDVKPCHTFLVKTTTDFTNLYLQICHIIYLKMERLQYLLYNEDMSETIRKQKEEEYELLKKYEDEAEEWYISYVIEKEREKENCDMWYVTLLSDPYEYEQYDYFSPIDIVYMAYHLALFDKEHGAQIEDFNNLLDKNGEMDVNYIVDRFEKCFGISMRSSIHQEKVNEYVKLHKNDKRVVDKILKNNDVYKNLHKARGRKKDMNMS